MESSALSLSAALLQAKGTINDASEVESGRTWTKPPRPTAAQLARWSALQLDVAKAVVEDKSLYDWDLDPENYDEPETRTNFAFASSGGRKKKDTTPVGKREIVNSSSAHSSGDTSASAKGTCEKKKITLLGGVDISFPKSGGPYSCAALIVLRFPSMEVAYEDFAKVKLTVPYEAGYLSFREHPALLSMLRRLQKRSPELVPDVVMVDGNGRLHPRRAGLACALGVDTGIPHLGIGKNFLHVDGVTKASVKAMLNDAAGKEESDCTRTSNSFFSGDRFCVPIIGDSGVVYGAALRTGDQGRGAAFKPIYVSVGHNITLEDAVRITRLASPVRVPEPVRAADLRSRELLRDPLALEALREEPELSG